MRVHLIKRQTIEDYVEANAQGRVAFRNWLAVIRYANWQTPEDIVATVNHADILGNGTNRVVFNIGGNRYRMICSYFFGSRMAHLHVNWIGTHEQYDALCNQGRQYTIDKY